MYNVNVQWHVVRVLFRDFRLLIVLSSVMFLFRGSLAPLSRDGRGTVYVLPAWHRLYKAIRVDLCANERININNLY